MATKMSYGNPFQAKGASAPNGPSGSDVTPELHIKMSKKIAQLTKVRWLYLDLINMVQQRRNCCVQSPGSVQCV